MNIRTVLWTCYRAYNKTIKKLPRHPFRQIYPIEFAFWFIFSHLLRPSFAEVNGNKMFLDPKDSLWLSVNGIYEPFETEIVRRVVKRGHVALDIGANIGYYTLIFARIVGQDGKVFAFEPEPNNFSLLKKNVEINGYRNVELVQKAVSNTSGRVKLYLDKENPLDHRIYNSHDGRKFIEVESIRLDDYFRDFRGSIDFIKMDIQGAEVMALQGMSDILRKNRNVKIVTEFWPIGLKRSGTEPGNYLKLLTDMQFKLYEINETERRLKQVDIHELLETYTVGKQNYTNLLCVRE